MQPWECGHCTQAASWGHSIWPLQGKSLRQKQMFPWGSSNPMGEPGERAGEKHSGKEAGRLARGTKARGSSRPKRWSLWTEQVRGSFTIRGHFLTASFVHCVSWNKPRWKYIHFPQFSKIFFPPHIVCYDCLPGGISYSILPTGALSMESL